MRNLFVITLLFTALSSHAQQKEKVATPGKPAMTPTVAAKPAANPLDQARYEDLSDCLSSVEQLMPGEGLNRFYYSDPDPNLYTSLQPGGFMYNKHNNDSRSDKSNSSGLSWVNDKSLINKLRLETYKRVENGLGKFKENVLARVERQKEKSKNSPN